MVQPPLPAPDDFGLQILVWLGVPTVLVIGIALVISVLGWVGLARNASAFAMRTATHTAGMLKSRGVNTKAIGLLLCQAAFIAWTWAVLQMADFFLVSGNADPDLGGVGVLRRAIDYTRETTEITQYGIGITILIIAMLDLGIAADLDWLATLATAPFVAVAALMLLGTCFSLLCTVVPWATDTEDVVSVYATWLLLCGVSMLLAFSVYALASELRGDY